MARTVQRSKVNEGATAIGAAVPQGESPRLLAKRRKRLAKVFARPLEKEHKELQLVREKYSIPPLEYDQLLEIKQRLVARGVAVKKSELVRAGLLLLAALDDGDLRAVVARVHGNL